MKPNDFEINQIISKDLLNTIIAVKDNTEISDPNKVVKVEKTKNPEDLYKEVNQIILSNWNRKTKQDIGFQKIYALILIITLVCQIIAINVIVLGIGLKWFIFDKWVIDIFIISVFGEIAGMALIIVNYLFPKTDDITDLIKSIQKNNFK